MRKIRIGIFFLKDKTVPVNGKELKVLDIIGAN